MKTKEKIEEIFITTALFGAMIGLFILLSLQLYLVFKMLTGGLC